MAVLNYTTQIEVAKTVGEVHGILAGAGADAIMVQYTDREPTGVAFTMKVAEGTRQFVLPVNVDAMHRLLVKQDRAGKLKSLSQAVRTSKAQAARVAWRVVKDWIEAQVAIIETEMVGFDQVMLPYMATGKDRTVYDDYRDQMSLTTGGE